MKVGRNIVIETIKCRSREGAWIERPRSFGSDGREKRRSREGAWIESGKPEYKNKKRRCRSREGAWIESKRLAAREKIMKVAPVRERGLKGNHAVPRLKNLKSLP